MTWHARRGIIRLVRTTLEIDEDVLEAMKKIAAEQKTSVGRVLSDLSRQAIASDEGERVRNGVPLLPPPPKGSPPLTIEMVNRLRDED
jgi:hypothetical protein